MPLSACKKQRQFASTSCAVSAHQAGAAEGLPPFLVASFLSSHGSLQDFGKRSPGRGLYRKRLMGDGAPHEHSDPTAEVTGFDEGTMSRQHEEEGDGLHDALQDDPSSRKPLEADPLATHQDHSEKTLEGAHVDEAHRTQRGDVNVESITQEDYGDDERMHQQGKSKAEKIPNEGFDDGLHRAQHGYSSSDQEWEAGYGGGLHRGQPWNPSCEQTMRGGGEAETKLNYEYGPSITSRSPQRDKTTNAQILHNSSVSPNLTNIGTLNAPSEVSVQENLAAPRTSGEHHPENAASAEDSDDDADEHFGGKGRHIEHSSAAYMAPFRTSGEHTHKDGFTNSTIGEHVHESMSTSGMPEWHLGGRADPYAETWQPGKDPYKSTPGNGNAGDHAPVYAYDDGFKHANFWGNVYDHTSRNNESDADANEKTVASDKTGGGDFQVDLSQDANSTQAPTFAIAKSPMKAGSLIGGSSYYKPQSAAMKNAELALRFGSAVFSLIAFSVIIATNEKRVAAGSTFYVRFSDYQAYNYLAALNLFSFLYSGGQLVLLAHAKRSNILSSPVKSGILLYLFDQILAILMVSSSSSAATASELSRHGLRNIWPPACSTWQLSLFCSQADVAVSMSFISFLFMFLSSFSSGYRLSKLLAE